MTEHQQNKINANKKLIGKTVWVIKKFSGYYAEVKEVIDEETLTVRGTNGIDYRVSLWDIRDVTSS